MCSVSLNNQLGSGWLRPVNRYVLRTIHAVNYILDYDILTTFASSSLISDITNGLYDT